LGSTGTRKKTFLFELVFARSNAADDGAAPLPGGSRLVKLTTVRELAATNFHVELHSEPRRFTPRRRWIDRVSVVKKVIRIAG
jgi:hypothetical protein